MKTSVEALEGNKVKLSVEVDEQEFERAVEDAFRKLAREVRIPGFRPGEVPRKVLEARLGGEMARAQALQDAVPEYYLSAVREHDVDVIAQPEIELTDGEAEGPVSFDAVVEVRPVILVPGYGGLRVTIERPEASDEELDAQLERLRSQFAELESVERAVEDGGYVTIHVAGSQNGEPVPGLTVEDFLYEVGSGRILPEVDDELRGAEAGAVLEFTAAHPAEDEDDIDLRVEIVEVKAQVLPELDDEWANEASEFATVAELRADYADRLGAVKKAQAQMALREEVGRSLAELVEDEVPEAMIGSEMNQRLQDLAMRLQAQGLSFEQWLAMSGRDESSMVEELREAAVQAVKVDLALRAVAAAEDIECTDEDLDEEFARVSERVGVDVDEVRAQFERAGQISAVRSDVRNRKAFDWLLERVEIVDADGVAIDRATLELDTDDDEPGDEAGAAEPTDDDEGDDD